MSRGKSDDPDLIPVAPTRVPSHRAARDRHALNLETDATVATPLTGPHMVEAGPESPLEPLGFEDRYESRAVLGRGGMGEVKLCRDRHIGRDVALKVVRQGTGSGPGAVPRFIREARIQGQLEHPAIVPVYDLGLQPDGSTFFTMKRVRGRTLAEIIEGLDSNKAEFVSEYSRRKLLTAFTRVCLAVDFAHSRGVIHRDLKPANIMLGDFGEVYVLDWGLARLSDDAAEERHPEAIDAPMVTEARTVDGSLMGTPGYMAPEQVRGNDELDARADIYSLGCILFELLALQPLHGRGSAVELLAATLNGANARVTQRAPRRDSPPELDKVCVQATELDPADRYQSTRELNAEIERFLDGDRDLAMRKELAENHAQAAAVSAGQAKMPGPAGHDARSSALKDVGRALALDPGNASALRTMVSLLVDPPREIPPQAQSQFEVDSREQARLVARIGGFGYLMIFLAVPLFLWMGIKEWLWGGVVLLLGSAAIAVNIIQSRRQQFSAPLQYVLLALSTLAVVVTSRMFGPFMLLPCLAIVNTIGFVITPSPTGRGWFIIAGSAAIVVPAVLEWTGVWAPSLVFEVGMLSVRPQMHAFPETATMSFLILANLAILVGSAVAMGRIRDDLTRAQQRLHLHTWQLNQLIPDEAQAKPAAALPGPASRKDGEGRTGTRGPKSAR